MRRAASQLCVPLLLAGGLACGSSKNAPLEAGSANIDGSVDASEAADLPGEVLLGANCLDPTRLGAPGCVCPDSTPTHCLNPCLEHPDASGCPVVSSLAVCVDLRSDPDHCGACGNACGPTSVCRDGACVPPPTPFLAAPVEGCSGLVLAAGGGSLFWTDAQHGTVMRAPAAGGPPVTLASGQDAPTELGVFGDSIYWLNSKGDHALMKVAAAGGTALVVATSPATTTSSPWPGINGFTVAADGTVYFSSDHNVYATAPDGGAPTPVVEFEQTGLPSSLALDGSTLVIMDVWNSRIYATPVVPGTVTSCDKPPDGQSPCFIAITHETLPSPVFAEGGLFYWVIGQGLAGIKDVPPPQYRTTIYSAGVTTFTLQGANAFLAVDGAFEDGFSIVEAPLVENAIGVPLAREPPLAPQPSASFASKRVTSIAADDASVFWSTLEYDATGNNGTCAINTLRR
jgi:hypothetical protein